MTSDPFNSVCGVCRSIPQSPDIIPAMTDPRSSAWMQPDRKDITIDDNHAVMYQRDYARLLNYSTSLPTGVYPGKMWRAMNPSEGEWYLVWFIENDSVESMCLILSREIIIEEDPV